MSLLVSPKTGKLVTVGSPQFNDLTKSKYRDTLLAPSINQPPLGYVTPSGLPPLYDLPTSPIFSPPSPPSSLEGFSLPSLSTVPKIEVSPLKTLPPLRIPTVNSQSPNSPRNSSLPSLSDLNIPKYDLPMSPRLNSPKQSRQTKLPSPHLNSSRKSENVEDLLGMKIAKIPTLEETLATTKQPARRAKLERMIDEERSQEGRGIKTRGWAARSPTRGKERHQLHSDCGDKCFLLPGEEKFPICASPRTSGGSSNCEVDCNGLEAALIRARQWGYDDVAKKAAALLKECNKEGLKHFTPSKKEAPVSPDRIKQPVSPDRIKQPVSPRIPISAQMGGKMDKPDNYLMPRRVARRNILLDNQHEDKHWNHEKINRR